jgi:polyphosphate kinase 2
MIEGPARDHLGETTLAKDRGDKGTSGKSKPKGNGSAISKADYLKHLDAMQEELSQLQRWLEYTGKRLVVLFEGRDTAGKGGTINAISDRLNPRRCRIVALGKPSESELTQWYFQRYVPHLPSAGEMVLFDRSWYNRAGVEAVMGFCTPEQVDAFLKQAPVFEKLLTDDGIMLRKYWLTVDQAQQEERFAERLEDPLKRWKLSPIDLESRLKFAEYGKARDRMLEATHKRHAPWTLVDFNDQRLGRLTLIRHLLDSVPDHDVPPPTIELPPLPHPPLKSRYKAPFKPIPPFKPK